MKRGRKNFIVLMVLVIISSFTLSNAQYFGSKQDIKLLRVLQLINNQYIDKVNEEEIVESAIIKMLEELDPHSIYISAEEVKEMNEPLQGNFEGIGVQFNILRDTIMVVMPVPGGPSEKVGIKAGDRIVKIDDEVVAGVGIKNTGVFDRLRGDKGSKVNVSIKRRDISSLLDFTITRDKIPIYSLDAAYMLDEKTGYIKINRFARTTIDEFKESLAKLKKQGIENLVLDLTGNGGGLMDQSIKLADEFLVNDQLIVYTEGLHSYKQEYFATDYGKFEKGNLVVLIDEGSASASEIVTGAVQDWDRAVVIGRRSFGKGLVQNQFLLPDGSMIRLTISKYLTPTGRHIQKPYDDGLEEYHKELAIRYAHGEMSDKSTIEFPDSLKYTTLVRGRTVYGGGGIMPDVFIPIDTTEYSDYYGSLVRKGVINSYVMDFVDNNRESLSLKYSTLEDFVKKFKFTKEMTSNLIQLAEKEEIEFNEEQFKISEKQIKLIITALIARDIFDTSAYYEIVNADNDMVLKAMDVFKNWEDYTK